MKKIGIAISIIIMGVIISSLFVSASNFTEKTTDSGLKVLFLQDSSLPTIQYQVLFPKAGADYDFEGKSGLASLTAYLLDQGAGGLNSEQLQEQLNQKGTELSVNLGRQTVSVDLEGLSWHKQELLELFKKILISPHLESDELEILKQQFLYRRVKFLDSPGAIANLLMRKTLFKSSYGEPTYGHLNSLNKINLEDVKRYYKEHFVKGNPVFMMIGDFDKEFEDQMLSFVNENFSYQQEDKSLVKETPKPPAQIQLLTNEELVQAEVRLAYRLFPFPVENPREFLTMKLGNSILGGSSMAARLFVELREKRGLTYGAYSGLSLGKEYGFFEVSGATNTKSVKEFLEQTMINLEKIKQEGVSLQELSAVKEAMKIGHLSSIETPENKMDILAYYNYYLGLDASFFKNYIQIIESITLEEVNQSLQNFILNNQPVQILIYGHPSIQAQLEQLKDFPPVKVSSFKDYFKEEIEVKKSLQIQ